jgi:ribosome-binding protein aMBF1 (putative translation factor)
MLTPAQVRAARALLRWSQTELALHSGVHVNPIKSFESEQSNPVWTTLSKLERALKKAGVVFIDGDEHQGPGVRLREPQR